MSSARRSLWAGRALALVGLLLVAINLRTAVAALSPIYTFIDADLGGGSFGLGLLGMLPPLCFAVFGIITPSLARRFGLEGLLVSSLVVLVLGHLLRGVAWSFPTLVMGSVLCFAAIGAGNVLLPPIVKKYFGDRIGQMTAAYATVMSISTFFPPLIAVPMAHAVSWQFSLGLWGIVALVSLLPWILQMLSDRRSPRFDPAADEPKESAFTRVARTPTAWAIMTIFSVSSSTAYTAFAWLPQILVDVAGVSPARGGVLLSLFGFMGLPVAIIMPILATRVRRTGLLAWAGALCIVLGSAGLLVVPTSLTWLWVALLGSGPLLFPLALTLINLRSRAHQTSIAASGFVQSVGYIIAAIFPMLFGILHDLSSGWTLPLIVQFVIGLPAIWAGIVLGRRRTIDEEMA